MDDLETLIKMLDSPKASVRYGACESLRVAPALDDAALAALERVLEDPDREVRDAASRALNVHRPVLPLPSTAERPQPEAESWSVEGEGSGRQPAAYVKEVAMQCPRCNQQYQGPYGRCPHCGFSGPPEQVEQLAHLRYLLREIASWGSAAVSPDTLRRRYEEEAQALEIALGLRPPILSAEKVHQMRWELYCLDGLQELVAHWRAQGWVVPQAADRLSEGARKRAEGLQERLVGVPPAPPFGTAYTRLKRLEYLEGMLDQAHRRGQFQDEPSHAAARADLLARRAELETEAGRRPRPAEAVPVAAPAAVPVAAAETGEVAPAPAVVTRPPKPPRPRLTWEQVWQTLLSRRTLNVLLFLGAFLLVASATYGVVYNWDKLPDWAQLLCILFPTALAYVAGWALRARLKLRASGIAVTAIASLLVPLDVLAVAVIGRAVPEVYWPWVWLITSALCLTLYAFTALRIRAEFFGYLVAAAAGSLLCAALQVAGVPAEWWLAGLAGLALALEGVGLRLRPAPTLAAAPGDKTGEPRAGLAPGEETGEPQSAEASGENAAEAGAGEAAGGNAAERRAAEAAALRRTGSAWTVLSAPLRFSALVSTAVLLLAGIGWWISRGLAPWDLSASLAAAWALGAALFAYAAAYERSPLLGQAAAAALPVALCLALRLAFERWGVSSAWLAPALAALPYPYLWLGHRLLSGGTGQEAATGAPGGGDKAQPAARTILSTLRLTLPSPAAAGAIDPVRQAHGLTLAGWGLALMAVAAGWSLALVAVTAGWAATDRWPAAATYALLAGAAVLAVALWHKPRALPVASLLALASVTLAMVAADRAPAEWCLGWSALALLHLVAAIGLRGAPEYAARLFAGALAVDALALVPPLALGRQDLSIYALGQWIVLAAVLAWLDGRGRDPGLAALLGRLGPLRPSALPWAMAVPLPFFVALVLTHFRPPDAWLGVATAAVGWVCFALGVGYWLLHSDERGPPFRQRFRKGVVARERSERGNPRSRRGRLLRPSGARNDTQETRQQPWIFRRATFDVRHATLPWYAVAYGCTVAGPALAGYYWSQSLLAVTLLMASALYFASAWAFRGRWWLLPAGLALPVALLLLLGAAAVPWPQQGAVLALIAAAYLLGGTALERRMGVPRAFLAPLNAVAHGLAAFALIWGPRPAFEGLVPDQAWPGPDRLWAAAAAAILAVTYGLLAWFRGEEWWAHAAAWLGVLAAALIVSGYNLGPGSAAFLAALLAALYVLAERALAGPAVHSRRAGTARAWSLFGRALLVAGWVVSGGAIALALAGGLGWLGAGREREGWAIVALLAVTALYAISARLFRSRLCVWLAGGLLIVPWTQLTAWGWFVWPAPGLPCGSDPDGTACTGAVPVPMPHYALAWAVLAGLELAAGLWLTQRSRPGAADFGFPLRTVAHLLLPVALLWGIADPLVSSLTWGLGAACYLASAVADHRRRLPGWRAARYLYPAVAVIPAWALFLVRTFWPQAPYVAYGVTLLAFSLPFLGIGRLVRRLDPVHALSAGSGPRDKPGAGIADELPLALGAYGVAVAGTLLVAHEPAYLAAALAYDTLLCLLSAWIYREPTWGYPAAALAPAALLTGLALSPIPPERRGWCLIGLGAVYLALAWLLKRGGLHRRASALIPYSTAPLASAFVVVALGLAPSSTDEVGAFWGYLAAACIYAAAAAWLRQPLLLWGTAGLSAVPYGVAVVWLNVPPANVGLALFPGVAASLALAHLLDWRLGWPATEAISRRRPAGEPLDRGADLPAGEAVDRRAALPADEAVTQQAGWQAGARASAVARWQRLRPRLRLRMPAGAHRLPDRWAAPWYAWAYLAALVAVGLSWAYLVPLIASLALAAVTFLHAAWRFRSRAALLLAGALAQGAALAAIDAAGWLEYPAWAALAFLPVTVVTAGLALAVQLVRKEGSPLGLAWAHGWSRPLYWLLAADLLVGQIAALTQPQPGAIVTAVNAGLVAVLVTLWVEPVLPLIAVGLGAVALFQGLAWAGAAPTAYPAAVALLALAYGLGGYALQALPRATVRPRIWRRPLEWGGLGLSVVALAWTAVAAVEAAGTIAGAVAGRPEALAAAEPQVQMIVWVLAALGALYVTTAVAHRWWVLGYVGTAMILAAWAIWWRLAVEMRGIQWYALPTMLYLLGIGWLEWRRGHKTVARWVDRVALLIGLGSAWWQSIPGRVPPSWPYALLLGLEGLALIWWGSARRRKEFLYIGLGAVMVDAVTQTIGGVFSPYRWLVLAAVGLVLVGLAVLVELRLERIRELSEEVRQRLEAWE